MSLVFMKEGGPAVRASAAIRSWDDELMQSLGAVWPPGLVQTANTESTRVGHRPCAVGFLGSPENIALFDAQSQH